MKRLLTLFLLLAWVVLAEAQVTDTLQLAQSTGNGKTLGVAGLATVGIGIIGSSGADRVVNFEASQDTSNWVAIVCTNKATAATATTATASSTTAQLWSCPVSGMRSFRARLSGGASGTVTVTATAVTVSDRSGGSSTPAAQLLVRTCTVAIGDPGSASLALANDNDTPKACSNDYGADWTITGVACAVDSATGTPTADVIFTGGATILTGAISCGTSFVAGTLSGTPVVHSFSAGGSTCSSTPCSLDVNITTGGGTAKYMIIKVVGTIPST